ncbi:hypothetical protein L6452_05863 [Arctium lappa]|uniref:Uncharacterized protein n=1 Tax=Arctium lappa TaxID=4217 RepID=A0ACB9EH45_ARCLA|nr:hypothetical protein L6452_05863 [Arctium lappa]
MQVRNPGVLVGEEDEAVNPGTIEIVASTIVLEVQLTELIVTEGHTQVVNIPLEIEDVDVAISPTKDGQPQNRVIYPLQEEPEEELDVRKDFPPSGQPLPPSSVGSRRSSRHRQPPIHLQDYEDLCSEFPYLADDYEASIFFHFPHIDVGYQKLLLVLLGDMQ